MPKLTVDGQPVDVAAGTNLIETARRLGIEVPHYCYHPGLPIAGACRLCMVDLEKAPRPTIACSTQAADGMVVMTRTRACWTSGARSGWHLIVSLGCGVRSGGQCGSRSTTCSTGSTSPG